MTEPASPSAEVLTRELQSLWDAYERNEADLTRMGHWLRLNAPALLRSLAQPVAQEPTKAQLEAIRGQLPATAQFDEPHWALDIFRALAAAAPGREGT